MVVIQRVIWKSMLIHPTTTSPLIFLFHMTIVFIPGMSFGDIYFNTETSQAVALDEGRPPMVLGMSPKYKDVLPRTSKELDMPDSEFEKLLQAALNFTAAMSEMDRIVAEYNPKKPLPTPHSSASDWHHFALQHHYLHMAA